MIIMPPRPGRRPTTFEHNDFRRDMSETFLVAMLGAMYLGLAWFAVGVAVGHFYGVNPAFIVGGGGWLLSYIALSVAHQRSLDRRMEKRRASRRP